MAPARAKSPPPDGRAAAVAPHRRNAMVAREAGQTRRASPEQQEFLRIESMKLMKFGVGQAVKRVEDVRLVTGRGNYTSDYAPEGALHAVFLRSPHAHAAFSFGDLSAARAAPGVKAVY